ncbi:Calcium channel YVC1 [Cyphellophora attinorum]|uniref:Calcium channel YVC1 n=1 Tax=Cyphellophora attinorum TaxID=1664694 RepID=A0A0N1P0U3_9EURO|nr:Calcium channel YVC1 [Phialophora attinorum]KPI43852.1 Calcium channel YVC1 [Phialophora attinorum]
MDSAAQKLAAPGGASQSRLRGGSWNPTETDPLLAAPPLLDDGSLGIPSDAEEHAADSDGLYPPHSCWTEDEGWMEGAKDRADPFKTRNCKVYMNIHRIRRDVIDSIDDPYSLDQLKAPRMNITIVRPLVDEYYESQDLSIIYCLLVNRAQFIREHAFVSHHQTVNLTRALLCEIIAERMLRRYNEHNPGPKGLLKLATILVAGFDPFQNAPESLLEDCESDHDLHHFMKDRDWKDSGVGKLTALEVAIVSESKSFLASGACQKVVDAIYKGSVVYTPTVFVDILPDRWKKRPVSLYDPRTAPVLNQYRLFVPRTRKWIELIHFVILLVLYLAVMIQRQDREEKRDAQASISVIEGIFMVYGLGWVLDQVASILEHGWQVYTQNLWSFLDIMFSAIFIAYLSIRWTSVAHHKDHHYDEIITTAFDVLGCGAPVLIPRLAFNIMSENLLFVGLRSMMRDFLTLTVLAIWSFLGFLLSIKWLHNDSYKAYDISKWMVYIWFGLDATGIEEAPAIHPYLGPFLMITFTFLGNTLFLTILISMLSNTFGLIVRNAVQEIQYRRAVICYLGVKSDSIFAYWPPFNILALFFVLPLKLAVSSRTFHSINVFLMRVINVPVLLFLAWYERRTMWKSKQRVRRPSRIDWFAAGGPRAINRKSWINPLVAIWDYCRLNVHGDIQAVFDIEPGAEVMNQVDQWTFGGRVANNVAETFANQFKRPDRPGLSRAASRRISYKQGRRRSTKAKPPPMARRSSSDRLKEEFPNSESDDAGDEQGGAPEGYHAPKRGERVDSLIDFGDNSIGLQEANVRLSKIEQTVERLEALLSQILEATVEQDGEDEGKNGNLKDIAEEELLDEHDSEEATNDLNQSFRR